MCIQMWLSQKSDVRTSVRKIGNVFDWNKKGNGGRGEGEEEKKKKTEKNEVGQLIDSPNGTSYKREEKWGVEKNAGGIAISVRCGINFSLIYTSSILTGIRCVIRTLSLSLPPSLPPSGLAREQRTEILIVD